MSLVDRISRALRNPLLLTRGFNRLYHQRVVRSENPRGIDIFDEDWDALIILDACRHDIFNAINSLSGTLSSRISKGSSTAEWLKANFHDRDLRDTVYVTANPQLEYNRERWDIQLHKTINVWLEDGWDNETGTVRAETLTEAALNAAEQFPNKRLVIHYMQPHYPFVPADTDFDKEHLHKFNSEGNDTPSENVWNQKFNGDLGISRKELWLMYTDNLEYVLTHVAEVVDEISGKTVITADHGNYVGERASPIPIREYGHPHGLYDEPLVRVPWLECEWVKRRDIRTENSESHEGFESNIISKRLQALGYHE